MIRRRVLLVFGGKSPEHEISLLSARNILAAMDRERFEPVLIGVDKNGIWHHEAEGFLDGAQGDPLSLNLPMGGPVVHPALGFVRPGARGSFSPR